MKTIKVSEAEGPTLDWLVAKCEGPVTNGYGDVLPQQPRYPTDWSQGGPIIEREGIATWISTTPDKGKWAAADARWMDLDPDSDEFFAMPDPWHGPTLLIAAMRCYVFYKLGETVEVPDEL